jgi:hypothetical protein
MIQPNVGIIYKLTYTDSGEGVCVNPGKKEAILEAGGKGGQLASDSGGG